MQTIALGLLWQDGDENILQRAQSWSEVIPRVYVVDLRAQGETFASLASPRLHYAPFRQATTLGCGMNRMLSLAYEDAIPWLGILDGSTEMSREQLEDWTHKANPQPGLYRAPDSSWIRRLFRTPSCGMLVSVAVARSLGGWSPVLPAQRVFADFERRLLAQGGRVEKGLKVVDI